MIESMPKEKIESRCGIECTNCTFRLENTCKGCLNIDKPFWGEFCPIKDCAEKKNKNCCGECASFPCDVLKSFAYHEQQGDNGLRIENCKKWCHWKELGKK